MHGRKRFVRSDEEANAEKQRQQKQLLVYRHATDLLFKKMETGFDDEAMEVSYTLLASNPDFITLWNCRRRRILEMLASRQNEEADGILEKELNLTMACLLQHPKSYAAWHHRFWSLSRMRCPNFEREFGLIDNALREDERNFHCWDYRKLISSLSGQCDAEQLAFLERKVNDNFSNYSAWHYRSKVLDTLYPADSTDILPLAVDRFLSELSLCKQALFTDPEDQSCWFYQDWLTAPVVRALKLLRLSIDIKNGLMVMAFNMALERDEFAVRLSTDDLLDQWRSLDQSSASRVWLCNVTREQVSPANQITVTHGSGELLARIAIESMKKLGEVHFWLQLPIRNDACSEKVEALDANLVDLKNLLSLEPENHLALVNTARQLERKNCELHYSEIVDYIEKAMKSDSKRKNYYQYWLDELSSEVTCRQCLLKSSPEQLINLSGKQLHFIVIKPHFGFVTILDVSHNSVESIAPVKYLTHLTKLIANHNRIRSMRGLETLPSLAYVDLSHNCIDNDGLVQFVCGTPKLLLEANLVSSTIYM